MINRGKKILLAGACILIVYGSILAGIGLLISENLSLNWWFSRLFIFLSIFSTTLLLGLYFLKIEK
jgi:hypothetical protein